MRPIHFLLAIVLLGGTSSATHAQGVFLQEEGKFLYPPNLILGDEIIMGMTIGSLPGFPVSATVDTENTRTDSHGKSVIIRFRGKIFRDSKGRTRLEWDMSPLGEAPKPGWFMIDIYDPTIKTTIHLQPSTKMASWAYLPGHDEKPQHACNYVDSPEPDPDPFTSPEIAVIPQVSQVELAHDVVDGMDVRHGHESVEYAPNPSAKNPDRSTFTDYWFSQQLQAFVLIKRTGPGKAQHTVRLSNISHAEPAHSLFAIPPSYQVSKPQPWTGECSPQRGL